MLSLSSWTTKSAKCILGHKSRGCSARDTTPMVHAQNPETKHVKLKEIETTCNYDSSNAYLLFQIGHEGNHETKPPHLRQIQRIYRPSEVGAHGNTTESCFDVQKLPLLVVTRCVIRVNLSLVSRHDSVGMKVPLPWLNSAFLA